MEFHFSLCFSSLSFAHPTLKLHNCARQQGVDREESLLIPQASCRVEESFLMRARAESHKLLSKEEGDKTSAAATSPDNLLYSGDEDVFSHTDTSSAHRSLRSIANLASGALRFFALLLLPLFTPILFTFDTGTGLLLSPDCFGLAITASLSSAL